jgi:hypothetical protein
MHMRPICSILCICLGVATVGACTSVLTNTPVTKRADGWVLTLGQVKQGPNEYVGEEVSVTPGPNENLIWAILTVKSELSQEETFAYEGCVLDGKFRSQAPLIVDRNLAAGPSAGDRAEPFNPGQERTRLLIFAYAKDVRPARMSCGTIALPIPAAR